MEDLKPYPKYKSVDIPWLKSIPEHWKIERAKNLYEKVNRPVKEDYDTITCFRDGTVTLRKNRRTTGFTESLKEIGYQGIHKGDLVIHVMDAFAGAIGVSDSEGKGTPVYNVCIPKAECNNYYYAHIIREMAKTGFIQSLYRGIRERSSDFRFDVFGKQTLPLPPLSEQIQIANYLDYKVALINKFIKDKKKEIILLKEQKQAEINQAVTRGVNPNAKMKDSGISWIGEIPEHWEVNQLKKLLILQRGHDLTSAEFIEGSYPVYGSNGIIGYHNVYTTTGPNITIGRSGSVGKLNYVSDNFWAHNTCIYVKDLKSNNCKYLYYLLSILDMDSLATKTAVPTLDRKNIQRVSIPFTNNNLEQQEIVNYITLIENRIETAISAIENQIKLIQEYKTSLISDVVTGKVDVRNIAVENTKVELEEVLEEMENSEDIENSEE